MKKSISTQELKTHVGEIVDTVRLRGDRYIIMRRGKPMAAIVPLSVNNAFERKQSELFALMNRVSGRNVTIPDDKIEQVIDQAVREARDPKKQS